MNVRMPNGKIIRNVPKGTSRATLEMIADDKFQSIVGKVLKFEGGYVDNPNDRGGETKYGISKKAYPNEDIKNLTKLRAQELYYKDYYKKIGADKFSTTKALLLFDAAVNHGVGRSAKIAQQVTGAKQDGIIGPKSTEAITNTADDLFAEDFLNARRKYYDDIIKNDPSQETFKKGWYNRLSGLADETNTNNFTVASNTDPVDTKSKLEDGVYQDEEGGLFQVAGSEIKPYGGPESA